MSYAIFSRKTNPSMREGAKVSSSNLSFHEPKDGHEQEEKHGQEGAAASGSKLGWSLSRLTIGDSVQRKCACGGATAHSGECPDCSKKARASREVADAVPPIVHEVLHSPGTTLPQQTRASMEARFGHDFSRVRIHTDTKAAESARAIHALAYTAGEHIAFAAGYYAPESKDGSRLLAHELTHHIQQRRASLENLRIANDEPAEREARHLAGTESAARRVKVRANREGQIARQPAGEPAPVPSPSVESEDPFKDVGMSKPYGRGNFPGAVSTWGWGSPETNNLYQDCNIAPLDRNTFKAFARSLPPATTPGRRRKPINAEEVLGITTFDPNKAKAPEISTAAVQENGKTFFKLKPTHAEMPPIRSAYTQAGEYVEGFWQDISEECKSERIRLQTSKFPIHWTLTAEGAKKTKEAEQEHCNDIRAAFDITLALYASAINNLAAAERLYSKPADAEKEAVRATGVTADAMLYRFYETAQKTRLRDDSDWHTAQPIGDRAKKDHPKKVNCEYFYTIDATSWPQVGNHGSEEVLAMTKAAQTGKPGGGRP
jgi:hypothetical protein